MTHQIPAVRWSTDGSPAELLTCDSKNVPSQTPKKPKDKLLLVKLEILDVFETATPGEQDRLRERWNSIPNIQDIDSVIAAARRARKNAKPFRVK